VLYVKLSSVSSLRAIYGASENMWVSPSPTTMVEQHL